MKKILFLLLCTVSIYGQTSTGQEQEFDYGIKNNALQTITTPTYIGTFGTDGTQGKIPSAYIAKTAAVQDSLNKKLNLPTGFLQGLQLSINADPTKFNIAAGYYVVTDFTNLANPVVKIINYAGATGLSPAYLASANSTYVALDINGDVISSASPFTDAQRRTLAIVGNVVHSNNTTINVTNEIKAPIVAFGNQLHDFMRAIGFLNESGNIYSANGANLQINKSVGDIFGMGINAADYLSPHKLTISSQTALTFAYRFQNGTQLADTQNINPNIYDVGGISTSTPSNKWTIQRINLFQSGLSRIQPGQTVYNSFNDAVVALPTQPFVTEQNIADNAVFRCYLIVQQGTTNLASAVAGGTAQFVPVDKFGNIIGNGSVALTYANIIAALGYTPENVANKQNSLATDGTGVKYPTVDAVNREFSLPAIIGDNQPQIQAKIDALYASGGGVVRLGSGNYTINSSIRLKDGVSIKGVAPKFNFDANCPDLNFTLNGGTRIVAMSAGMKGLVANEIDSEGVDSGIKALSNVFIEDLGLKGFEIAIKVGAKNQLGFGMGGLNRVFVDGTSNDNVTVVTKKAIELYNAQQMSSDMVLMYNVRNGLSIANNKELVTCSSGNSVWNKTYVYLDPNTGSEKSTVISAITVGSETTITTSTANELDVNDLVQLVGVTGTDGDILNRVHTVSEIVSPTQFKIQTNTTGKTIIATGTCEKGRVGIHLKASGNEPLNHITFYSPQVNAFLNAPYPNKAIVNIALTGTLLSRIGAIGLYHTDTEGFTDHHLYLDGTSNITHNIGTMIDAPPLGHIAVYNTDGVSFESMDTDIFLKFGDTRIDDGNNAVKYKGSYKGYRSFSRFPSLGVSDDIINNKSYLAANSGFQALEVNSFNYTVGTPINANDSWMPFRLMAKRATTKITGSESLSIDRLGYLQCENSADITITLPKIGTGFLEVPVGVPVTLNKVSLGGKVNIVGDTGQTVGGKTVAEGGFELSSLIGSSVTLMASGFSDWVVLGTNKDGNLGKIAIVDLSGTKFTNLNTAHNYVQAYTSAVISEESYSNGVYRFTVPQNTAFTSATSFLHNSACSFIDNLGLITSFGQGAFYNNTGNSVFGNVTFGDDSFSLTTGINKMGNCTFGSYNFYQATGKFKIGNVLSSGGGLVGYQSNGEFEINGNIGTTEAGNYAQFFLESTSIIYAKKAKLTSNAGAIEGDLQTAITQGCSLFFGNEKYSQNMTGTPTAPTATLGTNTTQIATTAFVQANARPYKSYVAILSQSGTSAPTATVLENTLGGTVVWTRTTTGSYLGTLTGVFTANKTAVFITQTSGSSVVSSSSSSVNDVYVLTANSTTATALDGVLSNAAIEIRVYP